MNMFPSKYTKVKIELKFPFFRDFTLYIKDMESKSRKNVSIIQIK